MILEEFSMGITSGRIFDAKKDLPAKYAKQREKDLPLAMGSISPTHPVLPASTMHFKKRKFARE